MKKECPICGEKALIERLGTFRFDPPANIPGGAIIVPNSKWEECEACGESILAHALIEKLDEQRYARLELLTPEQIRIIRENAGLTQLQIAEKLGIGEKTYTRWETGKSLQNKSSDTLIRLFAMDPFQFERLAMQRDSSQGGQLSSYFQFSTQGKLWNVGESIKTPEVAHSTEIGNYRPAA